jgi:hypothetical protein
MFKPKVRETLTKRFDEALSINKSLVWQQLAAKFDAVKAVAMRESVADEAEKYVDSKQDARMRELRRLLTREQDVSAEELERDLAGVKWKHALSS